MARFRHRIVDLKRFGIQTVAIDDFAEIEPLLKTLVYRSAAKNVFVSGSAHDFNPFGKDRLESLARRIGKELVRRNYNLVSGYGLGIGGACILGAHEAAYFDKNIIPGQRLILRLFPQSVPAGVNKAELHTQIRKEIIACSGAVIFVSGNKTNSTGGTILGAGVMEEFEIAKSESKILIPIPSTGHAALKIWQEIEPHLSTIFPKADVKAEFAVLCNGGSSEDQIIEAMFGILKKARNE